MLLKRGVGVGNSVSTGELDDLSVTAAKLAANAVLNAKVDAAAAIAYSKLNLGTSLLHTDVSDFSSLARAKLPTALLTETSEANSTPVTDDTSSTLTTGNFWGDVVTLPTDEKWYVVTGIEWKNGAAVAGNVVGAVFLCDADPPVNANILKVGQTIPTAQSGTNTVQRASLINPCILRGGSVLFVGYFSSSSSSQFKFLTGGASQNLLKVLTYSIDIPDVDATSWTAITNHPYVKLYYRGIK